MFLRDYWYVAALTTELESKPLSRQIVGEHVAIYRTESGEVVALADRCPHRGYPLSLGTVVGEELVCGYHGFTFDCSGTCVAIPGQDRIPSKAVVRAYPVVEQGRWLWIWMGEGEADHSRLPVTPWLVDYESWSSVAGYAKIDGSFELLVDNLLDLSHEAYLHNGSIGTPEVATTPIEVEVDESTNVVRVSRHMDSVDCPTFYSSTTGLEGKVDRWQDIEYFPPGFYMIHSRIAPIGQLPLEDGSDDHAFHMKIFYGLTPASEGKVHDFWALARDFRVGDEEVDRSLEKMQTSVVQEDVDALNILQARVDESEHWSELSVKIDRGGLAARRVLELMGETNA